MKNALLYFLFNAVLLIIHICTVVLPVSTTVVVFVRRMCSMVLLVCLVFSVLESILQLKSIILLLASIIFICVDLELLILPKAECIVVVIHLIYWIHRFLLFWSCIRFIKVFSCVQLQPSRLFIPAGTKVFSRFCQNISLLARTACFSSVDNELPWRICSIGISSMSFTKLHVFESKKCCTSLQLRSCIRRWLRLLFIRMLSLVAHLPTY